MAEMKELMNRSNAGGVMAAATETAEIADIQAKMILAKRFPRDVDRAMQMVAFECQNKDLAEKAVYEFPRGDSVVRGASIRLVECVARHWGNVISGIKEIATDGKKSTVKAFCWDLETNFADEKIFDIAFVRNTKKGSYAVTDERDKYEMMANMAARRKRACMQAIIPQFVIDNAVELCTATLEKSISKQGGSIEEIKEKMLAAFMALPGAEWVTPEDFSVVCGKAYDTLNNKDIVKLRNLYNAIKDGFVKPAVAFKREEETAGKPTSDADENSLDRANAMFGEPVNEDEGMPWNKAQNG